MNVRHDEKEPTAHEKKPEDNSIKGRLLTIKDLIIGNKLNILLICIPFGFMAKGLHWGDSAIFILCMLSIIPLAFLLGTATEELALRTNQTLGGLLNATFGNATELIISIFALKNNLLRVVQASLLGSILSNLLLVLGCAFFLGGIKFSTQKFSKAAANTSSSLLVLAMLSILAPAAFIFSRGEPVGDDDDDKDMLLLSRITAIFMFIIYVSYLVFQLKTHRHVFEDEDEGEEEDPTLSWLGAIALLTVCTVLIAVFSEYIVDAITEVSEQWGMSQTFIGIVLLPIVGNAAEHITAVFVAMKDKMDLSIGVAIGSSIQISLLVIPLLVLLGWMIGRDLNLYFHPFESVVGFVSVIIVHIMLSDGESNWLEGAMLLASYIIICVGFWFL
eukprot:Phypoly_transcript_10152.p1 GENE.Phypoly_transcript_10152~~Phypoly_transcript_10152.p1  ORF type:complete len:429 (+),score=82.16 Phypoly_transcript_10152:126-1289(+)